MRPVEPRSRPTIADVAGTAGVSKATVSRYFNHRERLLSPGTATRIEAAIAALGYAPNPMARALSHGRSGLIGLIVADVANPYSIAVLCGVEKACQAAGYLVVLFNLGNDAAREAHAIDLLASYPVEGFILNTFGLDQQHNHPATTLHGKPAVLVDRRHAETAFDFVSLDNRAAVRQACEHLIGNGWRELLYVTEARRGVSSRRERSTAFRSFAARHAGDAAGQVFECEDDEPEQLDAALIALKQRARSARCGPAVLAGNAVITLRVAAALARLGWRPGEQIGFVGFDDPPWAPLIGPGLTSIAQPTDAIGEAAATLLIERLRGEKGAPRQLLLAGELVVRGSSRAWRG